MGVRNIVEKCTCGHCTAVVFPNSPLRYICCVPCDERGRCTNKECPNRDRQNECWHGPSVYHESRPSDFERYADPFAIENE